MERYKNPKNKKRNMAKLYVMVMLFLVSLVPTYSSELDQSYILNWALDQGTGSIAFDSSGNGYHGTLANGANFETANQAFGIGDVDFDGGNDVVQTVVVGPMQSNFSISIWVRPDDTSTDTLFTMYNGDLTERIDFQFDANAVGGREIEYLNSGAVEQTVDLTGSSDVATTTYSHFVFSFNFDLDQLRVWQDNSFIGNFSITDIASFSSDFNVRLGTDSGLGQDFNGDLDEFKIFDFLVNDSQVSELFTSNTISLLTPAPGEEPGIGDNITGVVPGNIITSRLPADSSTHNSPVNFVMTANTTATCDLYIDNNLHKRYFDQLAISEDINLKTGKNHTYFWHCTWFVGTTEYFELTPTYTFFVDEPAAGSIRFIVDGSDFDHTNIPLTITSPCLEEGLHIIGVREGYGPEANPDGAYFRVIESNGVADFTMPSGEHEFCLMNGFLEFGSFNKTTNFNINKVYGNFKIGDFNVPNNLTQTYTLGLDTFDIYEKWNPKAWGQTWTSIIGSLMAFLIGLGIILFGANAASPQAILAGVILVALSLGYQISNLLIGTII